MRTLLLQVIVTLCGFIENSSGRSTQKPIVINEEPIRMTFELFFHLLNNLHAHPAYRKLLVQSKKLQDVTKNDIKFPCDATLGRSAQIPDSVHQLKPGDIKVVGAIGDSLSAGFGLSSVTAVGALLAERGQSFSGGGQASWRRYLTIPNLLKEFNPDLVGFSSGPSLTIHRQSQFNVAEGGAVSEDMPFMTKVFIKRLRADKRVNIDTDWKFVTLMIGDNDFCNICLEPNPYDILAKHKEDLLSTLRILRDHLPRTLVSLVPPPVIDFLLYPDNKPLKCYVPHQLFCGCLAGLRYKSHRQDYSAIMTMWQQLEIEIANYDEFDRDDFTVVVQPVFVNFTFPRAGRGLDYTYLSGDCFHLSQKGNARVSFELWNSMLEPIGKKPANGPYLDSTLKCPTLEQPFIYTRRNS